MNICIIGQYPPQVGGIATYTRQLQEKLESLGHNVYVLTYKSNTQREDNVFEASSIDIPVLRGLSFIVSSFIELRRIIRKYDIDVVHANYILPPGLVASLIRESDTRIVVTAHGSDINILGENRLTKPLVKYVINHVDDVYFVSKKLQEKALQLGIKNLEEKSEITPNTVNTQKFKPLPDNSEDVKDYDIKPFSVKYGKPVVVFIGNLVKQKGLEYLLEAKRISKEEYALLIYGDGVLFNQLDEYIKDNNVTDTYMMHKTTTPEKVIPRSDVMVLPSISEGASIVALESMSCGKPLVATDVGNNSSIITSGSDGIIVEPADPEKLAGAIDDLVSDTQLRTRIGENARKLIIDEYSSMKIPYLDSD